MRDSCSALVEMFCLAFDLSCEQLRSVLVWEQSTMTETVLTSTEGGSAGQQQELSFWADTEGNAAGQPW